MGVLVYSYTGLLVLQEVNYGATGYYRHVINLMLGSWNARIACFTCDKYDFEPVSHLMPRLGMLIQNA